MRKMARKKRNLRKIAAKEEKKGVRLTYGFFWEGPVSARAR